MSSKIILYKKPNPKKEYHSRDKIVVNPHDNNARYKIIPEKNIVDKNSKQYFKKIIILCFSGFESSSSLVVRGDFFCLIFKKVTGEDKVGFFNILKSIIDELFKFI